MLFYATFVNVIGAVIIGLIINPIRVNDINRIGVHLKSDRASLAYKVISFLDQDAASRYVLTHRESGRVPIASSIYETHLAQKSDSQKTRSGSLYGIATLYSWADERGIDLDTRLLSGWTGQPFVDTRAP